MRKQKEVEDFACTKCHFFEPSIKRLSEGYCFVKNKRIACDDTCDRFMERDKGGYFASIEHKEEEDEEPIIL